MDIWVSPGPDSTDVPREAYRPAEVVIEGLQFLAMDAPDPRYHFWRDDLTVDLVTVERDRLPVLERIPADCFCAQFWVGEWNGFIYLAGRNATLNWTGE